MYFQGFAGFILVKKLQQLKGKIKDWNRDVFGQVESSRNSSSNELKGWDSLEEERGLSQEER